MKMCQPHWDKLHLAIEARGMGHLIAKSGQEVVGRMKKEAAGDESPETFDPLMSAWFQIMTRALEVGGLYLMTGDLCPVCEALAHTRLEPDDTTGKAFKTKEELEAYWIDGPADSRLEYARSMGLVPEAKP